MTVTTTPKARLAALLAELRACEACRHMIGPVVHGQAVLSRIYLVGQAPGPHEGELGRPFAWTAGKTLFKWFASIGVDEAAFRRKAYMAAVARCFPGKDPKGGDRKPDEREIAACGRFLEAEVRLLRPRLVIPVGAMAIERVLGEKLPLAEVVGQVRQVELHGARCEAICLPHPSGASTWHRMEPGITLLRDALKRLAAHPEWRRVFGA